MVLPWAMPQSSMVETKTLMSSTGPMTFTKIGWCVVASNSRLDELDVLPAPPSLRTHKPGATGSVYDHNTMHPHAQLHHDNLFFDILQALIAGQVDPLALMSQHQTCNITSHQHITLHPCS